MTGEAYAKNEISYTITEKEMQTCTSQLVP